jgi:predicted transcriptional regulator YheO
MHKLLNQFKSIADGIAATYGKKCEVVVHDFTNLDASIVHIAGNVTGRSIGAPTTDVLLKLIREGDTDKNVLNYKTTTHSGKVIKSSAIFIHDENGEAIGCLGINLDVTDFIVMDNILQDFLTFNNEDKDENQDIFVGEINQVFEKLIKKHIDEFGKPVSYMSKEDKLTIIQKFDKSGVFLVKGGVDRVAQELGVSRFTVYNYIGELKEESKE